jgi:uncharacterized membrane protein
MSTLPLHPALVHVPLGLAMVMPLVAIALTLAIWRRRLPRGALALVSGLQLVLVGSGFVAMQLGHGDERRVEGTVPRSAIHEHEEAAETFVWVATGVLAASVAVLLVPAGAVVGLAALTAAGTLAVAGLGVSAGMKGGELVFEHGAATALQNHVPGAGGAAAAEKDDD